MSVGEHVDPLVGISGEDGSCPHSGRTGQEGREQVSRAGAVGGGLSADSVKGQIAKLLGFAGYRICHSYSILPQ